jgi:hypothetical protein
VKSKIREIHKDQWGAFIFQMPALGFAASNKHHEFIPPYTQIWKTADILVSQNLYIFGYDQHQLARTISPSITLKLSDFFNTIQVILFIILKKICCAIWEIKTYFAFAVKNKASGYFSTSWTFKNINHA